MPLSEHKGFWYRTLKRKKTVREKKRYGERNLEKITVILNISNQSSNYSINPI